MAFVCDPAPPPPLIIKYGLTLDLMYMIDIRDGVKECDSLCIDDVLFIIDDICIN